MKTSADIVSWLLEERTNTLVSVVLDDRSQRELLRRVPARHENVYVHHMTVAFKPDADVFEREYLPRHGQPVALTVTGYALDSQAQAVAVDAYSENPHPHITISVADGVLPVYSNELLARGGLKRLPRFTLTGKFTVEPLS